MSTFARDIEEEARGEDILGIVIGEFGWGDWYAFPEEFPKLPKNLFNRKIKWEKARPYLDFRYSSGFGAPQCYAITAWTENKIIFVSTYDGSTIVQSIPRNPTGFKPKMYGGG